MPSDYKHGQPQSHLFLLQCVANNYLLHQVGVRIRKNKAFKLFCTLPRHIPNSESVFADVKYSVAKKTSFLSLVG